ncbi:Transposase, Tc1-like [Plasmopara halstedii]|uniref:Transposase, Tc1-like n=1 Tax=Plasmopara halstedii TaxID=4781 RepID=A0A0P1APE6_PLAHL|nr:Transposase, Tc1-like [Plasmopara halstedii]CEG43361.1 Transposase, Tc1-like [Plasmopara halstedii]|eukprot:XP_024579730.1 Transposase, Tc1-like [Plasmopara halstedii]
MEQLEPNALMAIEEYHDGSSEIIQPVQLAKTKQKLLITTIQNHAVLTRRKKTNLTDEQRRAVNEFLPTKQKDPEPSSKLVKGPLSVAAMRFGVTADTVRAIWKRAQQSLADGNISADLGSFKCGRNIRSLAAKLSMSRATVHRRLKEGLIVPHSNALKPQLNENNMIKRVKFCLSMLDPVQSPLFQDMMNTVHTDEKWFYITKTNAEHYLAPGEQAPHRICHC